MLDIKYIREHTDEVRDSIKRRGMKVELDKLLELDAKRLELLQKTESLRSQLKIQGKPDASQLSKLQETKKTYESQQKELEKLNGSYNELLNQVPNLIAEGTPNGGEENNKEEHNWGKTELGFEPKDQIELGKIHDLFDFEAGAKVAGNKFYFTKDKFVRLWQAINMYAQEVIRAEGFQLMGVPHLVNYEIADGTGYMPRGEENQNYIDKDQKLVLIATSELPLTGYHKDDVVDVDKPLLYAGISPCYRLEAGAYGKFSKGLYRTHQFEKLEMYIFCKPKDSNNLLQKIVEIEEKICKGLEIPYRLVRIAAGDMSSPAYEKYDIEYWSPAENEYRELTSCSNCTDYQARNLNIRFRNQDGKLEFVHTLNGTAATSSRLPIAILENYQQQDGSVEIPKALQKYYGADKL